MEAYGSMMTGSNEILYVLLDNLFVPCFSYKRVHQVVARGFAHQILLLLVKFEGHVRMVEVVSYLFQH